MRTREALPREKMETTMSVLLEMFLSAKRIEGRTKNTIKFYKSLLTKFITFLGDCRIGSLSIDDARRFIAHLQSKKTRCADHPMSREKAGGLKATSMSAYVRSLKAFSSWLYEEGYTRVDLFSRLKRPSLPEPVIEVLSNAELDRIKQCINPDCFLGSRAYAIFLLLLDTGIRASELCTLTVENTHLDENYIKVMAKGRKERIVPLANGTKKAMLRYDTTFTPESDRPEFFLNCDGQRLTYSGLKQLIDRLGKKADIPRLRPHLFRHSFAVHYLMAGGDLVTLQRILGHTTIQVTQMYLHLVDSDIKVQHSKFSPVDCLGLGVRERRRKVAS
jgi:site-specific recombinase XerD